MHSIEIGSDLNNIPEVESLIDKVCEDLKLNEDHYGNILIAVTEAVNNAIIHGNKSEQVKSVTVDVVQENGSVVFSVLDQGNGFDFENLPDPTAPEKLKNQMDEESF